MPDALSTLRRPSCWHKVRHRYRWQAERVRRKHFARCADRSLHAYRCPECRGWHVGHARWGRV